MTNQLYREVSRHRWVWVDQRTLDQTDMFALTLGTVSPKLYLREYVNRQVARRVMDPCVAKLYGEFQVDV